MMLLVTLFFAIGAKAEYGGSGTQADPYIISSITHLQSLATAVNSGTSYEGKYFTQTADIDLSGISWTPIGDNSNPFKGNYNGGNHNISNLSVTTSGQYAGLFGYIKGGSYNGSVSNTNIANVCNVVLQSPTITVTPTSDDQYAGAVVGMNGDNSYVYDNTVIGGSVTFTAGSNYNTNNSYAGGIIGSFGAGNFRKLSGNKVSGTTVSGGGVCGGLVGNFGIYGYCFSGNVVDANVSSVKFRYQGASTSYGYRQGALAGNMSSTTSEASSVNYYHSNNGLTAYGNATGNSGFTALDDNSSVAPIYCVNVSDGLTLSSDATCTIGTNYYWAAGTEITLTPTNQYQIIEDVTATGATVTIADDKRSCSFTMPSQDVTISSATLTEVHTVSLPSGVTISPAYITIGNTKYYKTGETYTLTPTNQYQIIEDVTATGATVTIADDKRSCSFTMPSQNVTISAATLTEVHTVSLPSGVSSTPYITIGETNYYKPGETYTLTPTNQYQIIEAVTATGATLTIADDKRSCTFTMPSQDVTISATLTEVHTVSLPSGVSISEAYTTISGTNYYKTGETYTLSYTATLATGYEKCYIIDGTSQSTNTFTMPAKDISVSATISPITYTISYPNATNGVDDVTNNNPITYNIESETFTLTDPSRSGDIFEGWYDNAACTGTPVTSIDQGSYGDKILYAKWRSSIPLTLKAIASGTITIQNQLKLTMKYSKNGGNRQTIGGTADNIVIEVEADDVIQLFGNETDNTTYCKLPDYTYIDCSADCYIYGNIMSLIDEEGFATNRELTGEYTFRNLFNSNNHLKNHSTYDIVLPATTLAESCYNGIFRSCSGLTKAPELPATTLARNCYSNMFSACTGLSKAPELPATELAESCYNGMFNGCTGLSKAPELPATELAKSCYNGMFNGCTGLTKAPELKASTLAESCYSCMFLGCTGLTKAPELKASTLAERCYSYMFQGCTGLTKAPELKATMLAESCYCGMFKGCSSLTTAPELPATTLATKCYREMFYECTSLNYIEMMATDISATDCIYNWVRYVGGTGSFVKHDDMSSLTTGACGIPAGWTVASTTPTTQTRYNITLSDHIMASSQGVPFTKAADGTRLTLGAASGYHVSSGFTVTKTADTSDVTETVLSGTTLTMPAYDVTVTATASANTFDIVYHANYDGSSETCTQQCTYGTSSPLTDGGFTAPDDMALAYWNTASDGTGTSYREGTDGGSFAVANGGTIHLYAQWAEPQYTVPLTLEFLSDGTFGFNYSAHTIKYSTDGGKTKRIFSNTSSNRSIPVTAGQKLQLYGYGKENAAYIGVHGTPVFKSSADCYVYGNIMSLLDETEFATNKVLTAENTFRYLFDGNNLLKNHPTYNLVLPATTLKDYCYNAMFYNCTSLTRAPELPATTLAEGCYQVMFYGCTSLTTAPVLPATTLKDYCYSGMFVDCSSLNYIEMMAIELADGSLADWVGHCIDGYTFDRQGVPTTGTFVKNSDAEWDVTGPSGVPNGWTVLTDAIRLTDNADNSEVISQNDGRVRKVTLSGRTLYRDNGWNTLCLPFSLSSLTGTPLEGADVRTLESSSFADGTLTLNFTSVNKIEAGKPYIVKWVDDETDQLPDLVNPVFQDVTISSTDPDDNTTNWIDFVGTYSPVTLSAGDTESLYLSDASKLYYPSADVTIGACRAYFKLKNGLTAGEPTTGSSGIKAFVLNFDEESESNSISTINADAASSDGWFTLDGRRLLDAPVQKGMYIHDGRKVFIK